MQTLRKLPTQAPRYAAAARMSAFTTQILTNERGSGLVEDLPYGSVRRGDRSREGLPRRRPEREAGRGPRRDLVPDRAGGAHGPPRSQRGGEDDHGQDPLGARLG